MSDLLKNECFVCGSKKSIAFFGNVLDVQQPEKRMNANKNNNRTVPSCNACAKAGKPSNHFTKDRAGKVICPTILSTQCRYCKEVGHWADIKFCPALQQKEKNDRLRADRKRRERDVVDVKVKKSCSNLFSVLMEEEVAEEAEEARMLDEFPPLGGFQAKEKVHSGPSFASMAAKLSECREPIFQPIVKEEVIDCGARVLDLVGRKQRFEYVPSDNESELDEDAATVMEEEEWEMEEYDYNKPLFDEYGQQIFSGRDAWDD